MKYILPFIAMFFLVGCSYKQNNIAIKFKSKTHHIEESNFLALHIAKIYIQNENNHMIGVKDYVKVFFEDQFKFNKTIKVTATAYNSLSKQTDSTPHLAAWGDILKPGMKVIAVSRDLLKMGLKRNTAVRIKGLDGVFFVKDKMAKRWQRKIDIYMGKNRRKALNWGRRNVEIMW